MSETDPKTPEYSYPDLTDHTEHNLLVRNALSLDRLDYNLDRIAQSLLTLASQARPTTEPLPGNEPAPVERVLPRTEIPAAANPEEVTLPDGRSVPTKVVQALTAYDENVWPGALYPEARAAIAYTVISTIKDDEAPALKTKYPFCLDDPEAVSNDSPCIKRVEHADLHQDNNDGTW